MKMRLRSIFSGLVLALVIVSTAGGSYAGDKPLNTVAHEEICGDVFFTLGDSKYSGRINYNETYTVKFDVRVPGSGKEVKFARLYVYWVWSQKENAGVYPTMEVLAKEEVLCSDATYTDTKGFVGKYDYFSGVNVYNGNLNLTKTNHYSVTVKNVDANGSTFCVQGIGLLVIYECQEQAPDCQHVEYWVTEGCDMIYAEYGITPEMATNKIYFDGELDLKKVKSANLITVVPSGGYVSGGETVHNKLYFNEESGWLSNLPFLKQLLRLLFGYGGGVWSDVYIANDVVQIGVDQRDVTDYRNKKSLVVLRRKFVGFVFQTFNLIPAMNAVENVEYPMYFNKEGKSKSERRENARKLLEMVGLEKRANHLPSELSGGEQQRIAIARALANDPKLILADEPTGNLDSRTGKSILDLLKRLNEEEGKNIIMVTHDLESAKKLSKVIKILDGRVQ